jgi:hypothetical protein
MSQRDNPYISATGNVDTQTCPQTENIVTPLTDFSHTGWQTTCENLYLFQFIMKSELCRQIFIEMTTGNIRTDNIDNNHT